MDHPWLVEEPRRSHISGNRDKTFLEGQFEQHKAHVGANSLMPCSISTEQGSAAPKLPQVPELTCSTSARLTLPKALNWVLYWRPVANTSIGAVGSVRSPQFLLESLGVRAVFRTNLTLLQSNFSRPGCSSWDHMCMRHRPHIWLQLWWDSPSSTAG